MANVLAFSVCLCITRAGLLSQLRCTTMSSVSGVVAICFNSHNHDYSHIHGTKSLKLALKTTSQEKWGTLRHSPIQYFITEPRKYFNGQFTPTLKSPSIVATYMPHEYNLFTVITNWVCFSRCIVDLWPGLKKPRYLWQCVYLAFSSAVYEFHIECLCIFFSTFSIFSIFHIFRNYRKFWDPLQCNNVTSLCSTFHSL